MFHTKWWYSLKNLLEEVHEAESCGLSHQMPVVAQLNSCLCAIRCQNLSKCYY